MSKNWYPILLSVSLALALTAWNLRISIHDRYILQTTDLFLPPSSNSGPLSTSKGGNANQKSISTWKQHDNSRLQYLSANHNSAQTNVRMINGTENCQILERLDDLEYLGYGWQGHVFAANLTCQTSVERVALKLNSIQTVPGKQSRPKRFQTPPLEELVRQEMLYKRLRQNATDELVRSRFAVQIGTVTLSNAFLEQIRTLVNQREPQRGGQLVETWTNETVHFYGSLFVLAPGRDLETLIVKDQLVLDPERRRILVRNLVSMYRFLADRHVWHGDMNMRHVHFCPETNRTTLIDFDAHVLLDQQENMTQFVDFRARLGVDGFRRFAELRRLWELLYLISNICGYELPFTGFVGNLGMTRRIPGPVYFARFEYKEKQLWKKELKKCGFERRMKWFKGTLDNETTVEATFRALEKWVGTDVHSTLALDRRKDSPVSANRQTQPKNGGGQVNTADDLTTTELPRILMGIFSMQDEEHYRNRIRNTYLNYLKDRFPDVPELRDSICSLNSLLKKELVHPEHCRLIYTFVIGANPDGPTLLVNGTTLVDDDNKTPMTTTAQPQQDPEPDVTYLNIRENMNDGKSITWFRFATLLQDEHNINVDFVLKLDSDTMFTPVLFWEWIRFDRTQGGADQLLSEPLVYGGYVRSRSKCDFCRDFLTAADIFMAGGFYFLSRDLARFVSGPQSPLFQNKMSVHYAEDVLMSQLVHLHPRTIHTVNIGSQGRSTFCPHPAKGNGVWYKYWRLRVTRMDEELDADRMYFIVTGQNRTVVS